MTTKEIPKNNKYGTSTMEYSHIGQIIIMRFTIACIITQMRIEFVFQNTNANNKPKIQAEMKCSILLKCINPNIIDVITITFMGDLYVETNPMKNKYRNNNSSLIGTKTTLEINVPIVLVPDEKYSGVIIISPQTKIHELTISNNEMHLGGKEQI